VGQIGGKRGAGGKMGGQITNSKVWSNGFEIGIEGRKKIVLQGEARLKAYNLEIKNKPRLTMSENPSLDTNKNNY